MTELIQVKLLPMEESDRNQFILDNQEAFRYGALEEFGVRDEHFEDVSHTFVSGCSRSIAFHAA